MTALRVRRRRSSESTAATVEQLLAGLNPEQAQVVRHVEGPLLVVAVAGSGKTQALVRRIAHLVLVAEVPAGKVLAVTFSKKAADEMNERLERLLPGAGARVGTFHSLALEVLRGELPDFSRWTVDDRDRYRQVVKDVLGFRGMRWDSADLTVVTSYVALCKARRALPGTPEAEAVAVELHRAQPSLQRTPRLLCEAYQRSEAERCNRLLLTFDDMLLEVWRLFRDEEGGCAERWASRWRFVLQDEAQDESPVQRELAEHLARGHRNYMVVGDPAQAVYSWRGSDPRGLLEFAEKWAPATVVRMHRNYRCGTLIVAKANLALRGMDPATHLGVELTAERSEAGLVEVRAWKDADEEGEGVTRLLQESHADGAPWRSHVVLYRVNAQSRGLEEALLSARVPYVVVGGTNFYERREVRDLLGYLRVAAGRAEWDDAKRCVNSPFRFLGKAFVERVEQLAEGRSRRDGPVPWTDLLREAATGAGIQQRQRGSVEQLCGLLDGLTARVAQARDAEAAAHNGVELAQARAAGARPAELLEGILMDTDYVRWLTRDEGSESPENNRVSNVRELVRAAERFVTVDELLDYVDETVDAARRAQHDGEVDRVTLMSCHRSKGLEFPTVFVAGCNDRVLPHRRGDPAEERRLFYVAMTRARDRLVYSYVRQAALGAKVVELDPSPYLEELGLVVVEDEGGDSRAQPAARDQQVAP